MDNGWLKWCSKCPPPACTQADERRRHWRIAAVTSQWCHHWAQHCQVSKKKYLPTCMLGQLRWNMPKITISDAKLSEIYEQNEWHLYSRQCNLRFLSTKVLQSSVETCVNCGGIFIDYFTANLLQSVMVKKFWKSVRISRSYRQK